MNSIDQAQNSLNVSLSALRNAANEGKNEQIRANILDLIVQIRMEVIPMTLPEGEWDSAKLITATTIAFETSEAPDSEKLKVFTAITFFLTAVQKALSTPKENPAPTAAPEPSAPPAPIAPQTPKKRGPGRPKGTKNKPKSQSKPKKKPLQDIEVPDDLVLEYANYMAYQLAQHNDSCPEHLRIDPAEVTKIGEIQSMEFKKAMGVIPFMMHLYKSDQAAHTPEEYVAHMQIDLHRTASARAVMMLFPEVPDMRSAQSSIAHTKFKFITKERAGKMWHEKLHDVIVDEGCTVRDLLDLETAG